MTEQQLSPRVIAIASGRGGSGKTTIAAALAWLLAIVFGRRIALVDLDTQGSLANYLGEPRSIAPLTAPPRPVHGFTLFAGGAGLGSASVDDILTHLSRAGVGMDTVVVDCPPDLTSSAHTAVFEYPADLLLAIARLEPGSLAPVNTLVGLADAAEVPCLVLPNAATGRSTAQGVLMALRSIYENRTTMLSGVDVPMLTPAVSHSEHAPTSITKRAPLTMVRPTAPPSLVLSAIAQQLVEHGVV